METYELDPDVIRWGLHLLDAGTLTNSNRCRRVTRYDQDSSQVDYVIEGYSENVNLENDEAAARALQEEFSRINSLEASGFSTAVEEHLQASVLAQDGLGPSKRHLSSGNENNTKLANNPGRMMEDTDPIKNMIEAADEHGKINNVVAEMEISHSCACPGTRSSGVEDLLLTIDADEFALDGEVGKRLHQMVPVPHVPKVNEKVPSVDEEISDHQRLLERLQVYDLVELKVQGDGNCQFRALSDQLYRSPEHHAFVREQIIQQLKAHPVMYEGYVPMAYNDYLKKMSKSGEWGDHVTLQAAADWYGVKIFVLTSFKDTCYIEILPQTQKSKRVIFISFWAEVHYNSIYPERVCDYIESLSTPIADLEGVRSGLPTVPAWRSTSPWIEATDLSIGILAFVLEIVLLWIAGNRPFELVVLVVSWINCLTAWTTFLWGARWRRAKFALPRFVLPNGQPYGHPIDYVEKYTSLALVVFTTVSMIFKFSGRNCSTTGLVLSGTILGAKLGIEYQKRHLD